MKKLIILSLLLALILTAPLLVINGHGLTAKTATAAFKDPGNKIYRVETQEKVVALSFDDGPDPKFTLPILKILEDRHARATFFVVGSLAEEHPEIIMKIDHQGHELANHTWTHPDMTKVSTEKLMAEVYATNLLINQITGKQNFFFRPPKGELMFKDSAAVSKSGYSIIMWSIGIENRKAHTPNEMANRVLNKVGPGDIILLHDGRLDRTKTVQALPLLLDGLKKKGYQVTTVGELFKKGISPNKQALSRTKSLRKV